ncbi:hypothetical protein OBV_29020 [Oscillibacter valericigenes Sjm18-20]|nr:hypothetical protein OBV_29020 [Oscillibacter valericigenes Sjm18-20]
MPPGGLLAYFLFGLPSSASTHMRLRKLFNCVEPRRKGILEKRQTVQGKCL